MGKSRRGKKLKKPEPEAYDSDDERLYTSEEVPDKTSSAFYRDEVDTFHADREKILLDSGRTNMTAADSSSDEEEVLGIEADEDDDDEETMKMYEKQLSRFQSRGYHDEMASDMEEEEEGDSKRNDGMPDEKAWGKKKLQFYGADVSDDDDIDFSGSEPDTALLEEQEALAIQRRIAEQLAEDDFGLDMFKEVKQKKDAKSDEVSVKITTDTSKLSKREKLQLVKKESPELMEMIKDFKAKMTEVKDRLLPLVQLIKDGSLASSSGTDYVLTKLHLYLNYCVNVSFYTMLKAKRTPIHAHPVIKRIVQYRKLIKELAVEATSAEREMDVLLLKLKNGESITAAVTRPRNRTTVKKKVLRSGKETRKLSQLTEDSSDEEEQTQDKTAMTGPHYETSDEKKALDYYNMMKQDHKTASLSMEGPPENGAKKEDMEEEPVEQDEADGEDGKRAITYQIAKNKGLTPKRKKELRNPRVKNRMKFQQAKKRHKGKVRPVVTEIHRYAGETSGIRAGVRKSTKFK